MALLGGALKTKQKITGRMADALAELYLLSTILKRYEDDRAPKADLKLVNYCAQNCLYRFDQALAGVIENMAGLPCPHCGEMVDVFGVGGGQAVADSLSALLGTPVPLLGSIPIDPRLREGGDTGVPIIIDAPEADSAVALREIAEQIGRRARGLAGRSLTLTPV